MSLLRGLVSYYTLDGRSTDSLSLNDGSDTSMTYPVGKINTGANFSGSGLITILNSSTINVGSGDFSLSFWIKHTMTPTISLWPMPISKESNTVSPRQGWNITTPSSTTNNINFETFSAGTSKSVAGPAINDGNWHHVVAIKTSTGLYLYVDKVLYSNVTTIGDVSGAVSLTFGRSAGGTAYWYTGMTDEIGLWSRQLTTLEVEKLNNNDLGLSYPFNEIARERTCYKVLITADDGTVYDVTNDLISGTVRKQKNSIPSFTVTIDNNDDSYTDLFNGGELVRIYGDTDATTATTIICGGKIDGTRKNSSLTNGLTVEIFGRTGAILSDKTKIIQFYNKRVGQCIRGGNPTLDSDGNREDGVLYNTGIKFDPSNDIDLDIRVTSKYRNQTHTTILNDLADKSEIVWYLYYNDADGETYYKYFVDGSVTNTSEVIESGNIFGGYYGIAVYGVSFYGFFTSQYNFFEGDYGSDTSKNVNRVIVYGKEDTNTFILKTEEDAASQSNLWVKDKVVTDSNLLSMDDVQYRADAELSKFLSADAEGTLKSLGLPSLEPGEMLAIKVVALGLTSNYTANTITHEFGPTVGFITNVSIDEFNINTSSIIKERIDATDAASPYINLNSMENSFNVNFDKYGKSYVTNTTEDSTDTLGNTKWIAQSFTTSIAGDVGEVYINLSNSDISTTPDIEVEIRKDSAGSPSTTIENSTVLYLVDSTVYTYKKAIFGTRFRAETATTYWIVVKSSSATATTKYNFKKSTTSAYANGTLKTSTNSGSSWTTNTNEDLNFQIVIYTNNENSSLSKCYVTNDYLRMSGTAVTGTAYFISSTYTADYSITQGELRVKGNYAIPLTTYQLTVNSGSSWMDIKLGNLINIPNDKQGAHIKLRFNMQRSTSYPSPELYKVAFLYRKDRTIIDTGVNYLEYQDIIKYYETYLVNRVVTTNGFILGHTTNGVLGTNKTTNPGVGTAMRIVNKSNIYRESFSTSYFLATVAATKYTGTGGYNYYKLSNGSSIISGRIFRNNRIPLTAKVDVKAVGTTNLTFSVSADNGTHWETATVATTHTFTNVATTGLKWKVTSSGTSRIYDVKVKYTT